MRKKVFVSIMGGIGDQIFQFGFADFLKRKLNCDAYLDISYYKSKKNYNNFKFRLSNLSKKNDLIIKKNIFRFNFQYISYCRIISKLKLDILFPSIYDLYFHYNLKKFIYEYWKDKKKYKILDNSYYFGYWHNLKYLKNLKKNINLNLINIYLNKPKIKKFIRTKINNKTVCLHIRGGDFGTLSSHNLLDQKYYDNSISFYKKKLKNPEFHVFTNDLNFSKKILYKHLQNFKFEYVKNLKLSDIEEFSLFSTYKFSVIANSTFSLISSFLSSKRNTNVAPKLWLKGKKLEKNKRFTKLKFI